ncbi:hypothetical protein PMI41_02116 [Phyllobacterium sp. YR531]|nr:hypothetical protein PMI41_02116 [Phyllobacterium sp. YR531]
MKIHHDAPARFSATLEVTSGNTFRPWLGDTGPGSSLNVQVIHFAIGSWF